MTYMSVEREAIQKAFSLASLCANRFDAPDVERKYFRAIAHLIWKACGAKESGISDPARGQTAAFEVRDEIIDALRHASAVLQDEKDQRAEADNPEYSRPVIEALEKVNLAIAKAEGLS
jgi:hypothetical protein